MSIMRKFLFFLLCISLCSGAFAQGKDTISVRNDIQLIHLRDSFFIHVTTDTIEGFGVVSSNGLLVIRSGKALMIDTPMDEAKTRVLLGFLRDSMHTVVSVFIPGHWHNDCVGGLAELHRRNVFSMANKLTVEECRKRNLEIPVASFSDYLKWSFCDVPVECFYPGAGHSLDNIVIYFPVQKILFGGCLIKSMESSGIGNIADADVHAWPETLKNVQEKFMDAETIIPGHGSVGSIELIEHTRSVVTEYLKNH